MEKVAELFAKLADQYGPSVIEAAKGAARIEGYSSLAGSLIAAAIAGVLAYGGNYLRTLEVEDDIDAPIAHAFGYLVLGFSLIPAAIALWAWIDPWTWTAINSPELWIAKKTLKL